MPLKYSKLILSHLIAFTTLTVFAQNISLPFNELPLDDLKEFSLTSKNWQIVGEVIADRQKNEFIKTCPGTGILVNIPKGENDQNLISAFKHGDIELELEFMVPNGSNSGIYLQGRYEVQIFDSWGVINSNHSNVGGIYQRWDEKIKKGYEGRSARVNVSKAPGLWQHFKIIFEAPRFNAEGEKIKNAKFLQVFHNGVLIHENVEVTGPTRSAQFADEKALGPLMIQGDHGPVAIKNIKYKKFDYTPPQLSDIKYQYYKGKFEDSEDFANTKSTKGNSLRKLTWDLGHGLDDFAYEFTGNINIKVAGSYIFSLLALGKSSLYINGNCLFEDDGTHGRSKTIELDKGILPFKLIYYKNTSKRNPELGLFVEGPGIKRIPLHSWNSYHEPELINSIYVQPSSEPVILRGFMQHKAKKKTHIISVGEPGGLNYAIDLEQGALLSIWRGNFMDAAPMWHQRGKTQLMIPQGALIEFSGSPTIATLKDINTPWPDSLGTSQLRIKGYDLDNEGRPKFKYIIEKISIVDFIVAEDDNKSLIRTIAYSNPQKRPNIWARIAEGENISQLQDGSYNINKGQIYISLPESLNSIALIRNNSIGQELLIPVSSSQEDGEIKYSLIW